MAVIAAGCGAVSILFCIALKLASTLYTKYLKNPYVRVVVAALIVMGITFILQTDDYMGAGNQLIAKAIETGRARPLDFVWKIIFDGNYNASRFLEGAKSFLHSAWEQPSDVLWDNCWDFHRWLQRQREWWHCSVV